MTTSWRASRPSSTASPSPRSPSPSLSVLGSSPPAPRAVRTRSHNSLQSCLVHCGRTRPPADEPRTPTLWAEAAFAFAQALARNGTLLFNKLATPRPPSTPQYDLVRLGVTCLDSPPPPLSILHTHPRRLGRGVFEDDARREPALRRKRERGGARWRVSVLASGGEGPGTVYGAVECEWACVADVDCEQYDGSVRFFFFLRLRVRLGKSCGTCGAEGNLIVANRDLGTFRHP